MIDVAGSNLGQVTRYGDQSVSLHCPKEQFSCQSSLLTSWTNVLTYQLDEAES